MTRTASLTRISTVSVVIPVKDDDRELGRCLRGLSLQTLKPDEIVVVDNGSSDAAASDAGHDAATGNSSSGSTGSAP
ncbi:glycosyltransferase [Microbacterium sp. HD4P20]|uniref:glycosyltransferase family 2 protein n=1 Tax=Microbacterium sp. HD4P20 TaxID=2864874 RepID=UPI001C63D3E5